MTTVEVLLVCEVVVLLFVCPVVKSSLMFAPLSVTVFVTGPKPAPEAVTVTVPDVGTGMAYPPDGDEMA